MMKKLVEGEVKMESACTIGRRSAERHFDLFPPRISAFVSPLLHCTKFFLTYHICISKNGRNIYRGDDNVKEAITLENKICRHAQSRQ